MTKFKVGDVVKCVDFGNRGDIKGGDHYKITGTLIDEDGDEFVGIEGVSAEGSYDYYACRFELVESKPEVIELKVGDRVRIAKGSEYYKKVSKDNPIDTTGIIHIVGVDTEGLNISVGWDNGFNNSYNHKDLELAIEEPEVTEKTMDNLVKGDKIQRINKDFENVVVGQVYTFDRYLFEKATLLIEGDAHGYGVANFIPYKDSVKEFEEKEWKWELDETIDHDPFNKSKYIVGCDPYKDGLTEKDFEYMKNLPKEWITGAFIGQSNSGAFTATSEPKEATKHDSGKPSFSSIPQKALLEVSKSFTHGRSKYGKFNYSGQMEVTRYTDALQRHLNQYLTYADKDDIDESGVHHLANVACNALMALDAIINGTIIDDRNPHYKK